MNDLSKKESAREQAILGLVKHSRDAIVCSIDEAGYPNAKAMFIARHEGLRTFWFSTNVSAIRTPHWQERPQACIYIANHKSFHGLMLTGRMHVLTDPETKHDFWRKGDEQYYPLGPTDPDYCILRFEAENANYYHRLGKETFAVPTT